MQVGNEGEVLHLYVGKCVMRWSPKWSISTPMSPKIQTGVIESGIYLDIL